MKDIRINIKLPSATEVNKDLDTILKKVTQNSKLDLKIDTSAFTKSIGEMSKALASLKSQLGNFNVLEKMSDSSKVDDVTSAIRNQNRELERQGELLKTASTFKNNGDGSESLIKEVTKVRDEYNNIIETVDRFDKVTGGLVSSTKTVTDEIEKQKIATEKQEAALAKLVGNMQGKLSISGKNGLIDDNVISELQGKLNSITTDTPSKEIEELKNAINNLSSSDNAIVRLQNAITKYGITIGSLKNKYGDIVPEKELNEAIATVDKLKATMASLQSGENISNTTLNSTLNQGSASMKTLTSATKNASEQQRLYNKEVVSFSGAFKDVASKIGIFSLVYTGINAAKNAFNDGVKSIVEMDTALSNLNKVVDLSDSQLLKMRDSAVSMGQELGRSATQVANSMAEFGRLYKDMETINAMTEASIIGANVMDGTNPDQVAKGLSTIISSMKLEAEDAITILDSLNEVQNNYRVSASSMLDGLAEVGSVANTAGLSLQELEGIITSISVSTGKSGNEVGTSVNSILSRLYRTGLGGIEDDGKSEKALKSIGVAVRDVSGEFRDAMDIFNDINSVWGNLTETQKIFTATQVSGTTQFNEFLSLFNNYDMALASTSTALDSMGSATKENEIYLNSINGKMQSLKATTEGFWFNFIDSNMIKGGIDALTGLVSVMDKVQTTFGGVGSTVGVLSSAFLLFTNNPLKSFASDIVKHTTTLGGFSDKLNQAKVKIAEAGTSMSTTQKATTLLGVGFDGLGIKALATQIKVIALQTALSFGLGLAITAVVGGMTKLISAMTSGEKSMEDSQEQADTLSKSLDDVARERDLSSQYKDITLQLRDANLEETKRNELKSSLDLIMKELLSAEEGYYGILKNENLTLEEQLEKMEQIRQGRLFDEAGDLDKDMLSQNDVEDRVKKLKEYTQSFNDIQNAVNSGNSQKLIDLIGVSDINEANAILGQTKNKINELDGEILSYNSSVALMKDANYETTRSLVELDSDTNNFIQSLNESTSAIDENTKSKEENADIDNVASSIQDSTKSFVTASDKAREYDAILQDIIEKQMMTPELMSKVVDIMPEIGIGITDVATVQDELNKKIEEQVRIQQEAYATLIENDEAFYNSKIKTDDSYRQNLLNSINKTLGDHTKGYNIDLGNYKNLAELKSGVTAKLSKPVAEWINGLVGGNIAGYEQDLQNSRSWAEAKSKILARLNDQINQLNYTLNDESSQYRQTMSIGAAAALEQKLNNLKSSATKIDTFFGDIGASFSNISIPSFGIGSSIAGGSVGSSGSSSKTNEKEVENMEDLTDRYYYVENALQKVNNELEYNRTLMENASSDKMLSFYDKEIALLKDKKVALENIRKENQKELAENKKALQTKGFKFDSDGSITNANQRLKELTSWANSLAGDDKQNAKNTVKEISEVVKDYTDLLLKQIPEVTDNIENLKNETVSAQREIAGILEKQKETYISNLEEETDNLRKEIEKRKQIMNSQWEEEDYKDELRNRQNSLLDLEGQLQDAMRMADGELISSIKKQIELAQSDINTFIRDNERENANEMFDEELEMIDSSLQGRIDEINAKLTEEEILSLVQNGVRDLNAVLDDVGKANKGITNTFASVGTIIEEQWIGKLNNFIETIKSIPALDILKGGFSTSGVNLASATGTSPSISINAPLTIQGDVNDSNKEDIEYMVDTKIQQLKRSIEEALNYR